MRSRSPGSRSGTSAKASPSSHSCAAVTSTSSSTHPKDGMRAATATRSARRRSSRESLASRRSPSRARPSTRSRRRAPNRRSLSRRGMTRERRSVVAVECIGPYALLRVTRGSLDRGGPGQFFMLEAPGRVLPRPMSLCLAPRGELAFLIDPIGPGTTALARLEPGDRIHVFGPLGNGFRLDVPRPLLVGGGIGIAPLPYLAEALEHPPAVLGFRSAEHAQAAALLPHADVVIDPTLVTDVMPVN